jgi:hypothetical protein
VRRKRWIGSLGIVALLAWLSACSKPPEVPSLPRRDALAIQTVVLSDKVGPDDVRRIFRALNQNGSLKDLRPYFETASDQAMDQAGKLITKYLYQDQTLLSLLRSRFQKKDFTRLDEWVTCWSKSVNFPAERDLTLAVWRSKRLPRLFDRDIFLLDNELLRPLKTAVDQANSSYVPITIDGQPDVPTPAANDVVTDIKQTLDNKDVVNQLVTAVGVMDRNRAGAAILQGLHSFQDDKRGASQYFEGFGHGLRKMLESRVRGDAAKGAYLNQLDLLLHFADVANQDTRPLFLTLQTGLSSKNVLVDSFNASLQAPMLGAITGWVKQKINDANFDADFWSQVSAGDAGPTPQFNQLFEKILEGVNEIIPLTPDGTQDQFVSNAPLLINSFALAKWFESMVKLNPKIFVGGIGDTVINVGMVQIPFAVQNATLGIDFPFEKQMTDSKFGSFVPAFRQFVSNNVGAANDYNYLLTRARSDQDNQMTMSDALAAAVRGCNDTYAFAQIGPVVRELAYNLTHPSPGSLFAFANFGTVSLMDSLNKLIASTSLPTFRSIKDLLFGGKTINLSNLDPGQRNILIALLKGSPTQQSLLIELLNSVQAVPQMDIVLKDGLPTAFETYFAIDFVSTGNRSWISSFLSFLSRGRFFGLAPNQRRSSPLFPAAFKLVQGSSISHRFYELSWLDTDDQESFLTGFSKALGVSKKYGSGTQFHLDFLSELIVSNRPGVEAIWDRLVSGDLAINSFADLFTDAEYDWAYRAIAQGDHEVFWRLVQENGSTPQLAKFVHVLLELLRNHSLERALDLLAYINDTRIKDLAATMLEMYRSGELERLLTAAETYLGEG